MSLDVQFLACERTRAGTRARSFQIFGALRICHHIVLPSAWCRRVRAVRLALSKRIAIGSPAAAAVIKILD